MNLNCKPGDLAVVVSAINAVNVPLIGAIRKLTTCVPHDWTGAPCWEYEGERLFIDDMEVRALSDRVLRPIRDQPGEDETLTWAGKPQSLPAPILEKLTALTVDCPNDASAEDAVMRNPTWTARVVEKGVVVGYYYGERVKV